MSTLYHLPNSDRLLLTVRVTRDGHREWLTADGRTALVYHERGRWWARRSSTAKLQDFDTETQALDALLCDEDAPRDGKEIP